MRLYNSAISNQVVTKSHFSSKELSIQYADDKSRGSFAVAAENGHVSPGNQAPTRTIPDSRRRQNAM